MKAEMCRLILELAAKSGAVNPESIKASANLAYFALGIVEEMENPINRPLSREQIAQIVDEIKGTPEETRLESVLRSEAYYRERYEELQSLMGKPS